MKEENNRWITIGLVAGLVAALGDFGLDTWLGWLSPGYHFLTDSMSVLGVSKSPFRWVFAAWGVLFAVLTFFYARALLLLHPDHKEIKSVAILVIIYGLGEGAGSGIFPFNRSAQGDLTLSGVIHSLVSIVGVIGLLLVPLFMARYFKLRNKTGYRASAIVPAAGVILLLMFGASRYQFSRDTFLAFRGLWQRLFLMLFYLYLMLTTLVLIRDTKVRTADETPP